MKQFIINLKYILFILEVGIILTSFNASVDMAEACCSADAESNDAIESMCYVTKNIAGEVTSEISDQTYKLHGNIKKVNSSGQTNCEGYKLKLKGSSKTATVKQLGQYLFEDMPIGHNIIEIYDENGNYLDMFEIVFNEGGADYVSRERKIIYIDLDATKRDPEFKDKFQVSFSFNEADKIHFDEIGTYNDIIGDIELITLDETINIYGQVIEECEDADPLPGITLEVEDTDISCTTGIDGDFILLDVPIDKQKVNFYDAKQEYIDSVEILFNIDSGDICLCNMKQMIIDVGNRDGRIFTNMQIGFTINSETRTLSYNKDKINGNVESPKNKKQYTKICILFVFVFIFVIIFIDRRIERSH